MEQASFECSGTRTKERPSRAVVRVTGAHLSGRYSCNNKMAWRFHSLVTSVSESFSVFLNVGGQLPVPSHSGEPIVSAILPKSPGEAVGHAFFTKFTDRRVNHCFGHVISELLFRNPTTGIAGCCARAASGHAAAPPPSSVMNSRRFIFAVIRSPRRRARAAWAGCRGRAPWRQRH